MRSIKLSFNETVVIRNVLIDHIAYLQTNIRDNETLAEIDRRAINDRQTLYRKLEKYLQNNEDEYFKSIDKGQVT